MPRRPWIARDKGDGAEMLFVEWKPGEAAPFVEVTSRIAVRDRAVDFDKPSAAVLSRKDRAHYLRATELIPTDGIVKETSDKIIGGATNDLDKARLIYAWVVENTFRDPKTRGCGSGDIASMLKSGNLGGKCADINALYVGLARAAGLPARDLYGLRVAPSKFGYKSLGAKSEIVTKAQHCRAEVFLSNFGWVPVDPADVRKVMLEEVEGGLPADDPKVVAVREKLFGAWEGNWIAYNSAHDLALPGPGPKVAFLMYPQADVAVGAARLSRRRHIQIYDQVNRSRGLTKKGFAPCRTLGPPPPRRFVSARLRMAGAAAANSRRRCCNGFSPTSRWRRRSAAFSLAPKRATMPPSGSSTMTHA